MIINSKEVMSQSSEKEEWAEHTILHKVNQVKEDSPVLTIAVEGLDATTPIAMEFIDFL